CAVQQFVNRTRALPTELSTATNTYSMEDGASACSARPICPIPTPLFTGVVAVPCLLAASLAAKSLSSFTGESSLRHIGRHGPFAPQSAILRIHISHSLPERLVVRAGMVRQHLTARSYSSGSNGHPVAVASAPD